MNATTLVETELTCPHCGHVARETMPRDACQYFYECTACHTLLRPEAGDCCVFCSYGTVPCPPVQEQGRSCCAGASQEPQAQQGLPVGIPAA